MVIIFECRHQLALSIRESEQHQNKIQELEKVIESKSHTEGRESSYRPS